MASIAIRRLSIAPLMMLFLLSLILSINQMAEAQTSAAGSCAANLVPCANYLNSTKPPPSCCGPLKIAVTQQLACLCNLYKNQELMKSLNVNVTQALALPGYCGIPGDINECSKLASSPSSPSSSTKPPPPPPVTPSGMKSNSGVNSIACIGLSILFLIGTSLML